MEIRRWLAIAAGLCMSAAVLAQAPDSLWSRTYGSEGVENSFSMVQTANGWYTLAGWQLPFGGTSYDFRLVRTTGSGDTVWTQSYGGAGNDYCFTLCSTADGGYAMGGYTETQAVGPTDAWVVKTDAYGVEEWNHRYGGAGYDWCLALKQTSDGGYILAGWTDPQQYGIGDGWLARTNASGDTLWTRRMGGNGEDRFYDVRQTSDGGFVCGGRTSSSGAGGYDAWVVRSDSSGQPVWSGTYGGSSNDRCYALELTSDGGFICAGSTESFGAGGEDAWLIRLNADGDTLWTRRFGGAQTDRAWSVMQTADGGFTFAGHTQSAGAGSDDFWIVHLDASGNQQWSRTLGGSSADLCYHAIQTIDGGYALAGQTASFGSGADDMWLVKLSATGSLVAPQDLVIKIVGSDVRLCWPHDSNPYYLVYGDTSPNGNFASLYGMTPDTTIVIHNGALFFSRRFYRVVGSDSP